MVCSLGHEGLVAPGLARIWVERDCFTDVRPTIHVCRQCDDAACARECPSEAIVSDPLTGALVVDASECVGCGVCVDACEFGMIRIYQDARDVAFKCDLCGGSCRCVEHCPQRALVCERIA
jgi:anaerobic carbon-monoxide dehydrogenase iron sulfur subunit